MLQEHFACGFKGGLVKTPEKCICRCTDHITVPMLHQVASERKDRNLFSQVPVVDAVGGKKTVINSKLKNQGIIIFIFRNQPIQQQVLPVIRHCDQCFRGDFESMLFHRFAEAGFDVACQIIILRGIEQYNPAGASADQLLRDKARTCFHIQFDLWNTGKTPAVPDNDHRYFQARDAFHEIIGEPSVKQDAEHAFRLSHNFVGKTVDLKVLKFQIALIEIKLHVFPRPRRRITELAGAIHIDEQYLAAFVFARNTLFQESPAPHMAFYHAVMFQRLQCFAQCDSAARNMRKQLLFRHDLIAGLQFFRRD